MEWVLYVIPIQESVLYIIRIQVEKNVHIVGAEYAHYLSH